MIYQIVKQEGDIYQWAGQFKAAPTIYKDREGLEKYGVKFDQIEAGELSWERFLNQLEAEGLVLFYMPDQPDFKIMPRESVIDGTTRDPQDFDETVQIDITESDHQNIS